MNDISRLSAEEIEKIALEKRKAQKSESQVRQGDIEASYSPSEAPSKDDLYLSLNNLPSLSKFYHEPLKAQPLKTMDTIILSNVNNENYIERYTDLFSKRISGVNPEQILTVDEDFILIWLRENTFPGYPYRAESYKCTSCSQNVNAPEFYYDQFVFDTNADEIHSDKNIIELDDGKVIEVRVRRRFHDIAVEKYISENYTNFGQTISKELKKILKLAVNLNIENCGDIEERANYLIHELSPLELIELLHKMRDKTLRCKISASVKCPHCSADNSASFFFRAGLFFPTYQSKRSN